MTLDEKIRLGILALGTISAVIVAAHFGHVTAVKPPFLDEMGGGPGGP